MKKQPEALISELESASILIRRSCNEIRRLHALCEEQKRLLEQALYVLERNEIFDSGVLDAINNHLRQHEGEKHDHQTTSN